jgi:hypothetical protein
MKAQAVTEMKRSGIEGCTAMYCKMLEMPQKLRFLGFFVVGKDRKSIIK